MPKTLFRSDRPLPPRHPLLTRTKPWVSARDVSRSPGQSRKISLSNA